MFETGFHHVVLVSLELARIDQIGIKLIMIHLLCLLSTGIKGMSHHASSSELPTASILNASKSDHSKEFWGQDNSSTLLLL